MQRFVNGYLVEYTIGFEKAEVRKYNVDEFGRLTNCNLIFRGSWEECIEYAENN